MRIRTQLILAAFVLAVVPLAAIVTYSYHSQPPRRRPAWDEVIDEAVRFVEEFERTRPEREVVVPDVDRRKGSRNPGKGRTGREEWT